MIETVSKFFDLSFRDSLRVTCQDLQNIGRSLQFSTSIFFLDVL